MKNTLLVTQSAICDLMIDDEFVVIYIGRKMEMLTVTDTGITGYIAL